MQLKWMFHLQPSQHDSSQLDRRTFVHFLSTEYIAPEILPLSGKPFKSLAKCIALSTQIISLHLCGVQSAIMESFPNLRDHDANSLASLLRKNKSIIQLDLSYNQICDKGAKQIASALVHSNRSLKVLHIPYNHIGISGLLSLANILAVNPQIQDLQFHSQFRLGLGSIRLNEDLNIRRLLSIVQAALKRRAELFSKIFFDRLSLFQEENEISEMIQRLPNRSAFFYLNKYIANTVFVLCKYTSISQNIIDPILIHRPIYRNAQGFYLQQRDSSTPVPSLSDCCAWLISSRWSHFGPLIPEKIPPNLQEPLLATHSSLFPLWRIEPISKEDLAADLNSQTSPPSSLQIKPYPTLTQMLDEIREWGPLYKNN